MSELSFEQMLEDSVKTIRNGEIVQGTVIDVKEDEIILNIGYKADGIITKNEYSNDASLVLTDAVHVGDTMEAKVLKVNDGEGQVTLTYKRLAAEKGNKRLEEAFENQEVLKETGRSFRKQRSSESKSFSGTEWRTERSDRRSKSIHSCKPGFRHIRERPFQICRSGDRIRYHRIQPEKTPHHR